jgi:two-component system OmpR family sensor kinase
VVVALGGLVVADLVIYHQVDSYLGGRVDDELASVQPTQLRVDRVTGAIVNAPFGATDQANDAIVELWSANGQFATSNDPTVRLHLPASVFARLDTSSELQLLADQGPLATSIRFSATSSNGRSFRVIAMLLQTGFSPNPLVLDVGIPLATLDGTLHQLLLTELAVTLGVLLLLLSLGYAVVRIGLRPLVAMETTAAAIADGDLSRRVESDDEHTEVGRLGHSLNVMLSRIEQAFAEQSASEARLRQFVSDASHELRTPVTSIRGYAELFRRGAANRPEDLALAMRRIEDESIRMGGLVEDLLLLARLDEGRPLERTPVDLASIAADAVADARVLDPERTIVLHAPAPVVIEGDSPRLRQIAGNLVQNALRYTPGSAAVTVSARKIGDRAVFSVSDEGPGIEAVHAAHIFERFYRGDPSRARGSGGSGLGLAIVSSIAEAHGGTARLETELGEGSRFIVEIPLVRPDDAPVDSSGRWGSPEPAGAAADRPPDLDAADDLWTAESLGEEGADTPSAGPGGTTVGPDGVEEDRADPVAVHEGTQLGE